MTGRFFYWKLHLKVKFIYWVNHQKLKWRILTVGWEDRFEHDTEFDIRRCKSKEFLWLLFKAIILNKICWNCKGHGMTGYYEPEACPDCDGYCFNWTEINEPDWTSIEEHIKECRS